MIPTVEDFKSSPLTHRFGDLFNPPGLTNFLGTVQTETDLLAFRSLLFPPLSGSDQSTAGLFIDGRYFPSTGAAITFTWYPDRIVREASIGALLLRSITVLPWERTAAMVLLEIENSGSTERSVEVTIGLRAGVTKQTSPWLSALPPMEHEHEITVDRETRVVSFVAKRSGAASVQGTHPAPDRAGPGGLSFDNTIPPGETWRLSFVNGLGHTLSDAMRNFSSLVTRVPEEIERTKREWNEEIAAVFRPGNSRFSGFLPTLETSDADLRRIYHTGALGVVYFKRESPHSTFGRAYDTLMPRYWSTVTFLWDYSLSSLVHSLLDPSVMRKYLQHWMRTDVHKLFGTEWLTGGPVGGWYSVNDFAMTKILHDYLRWTGDLSFLEEPASPDRSSARVLDHLERYATNWMNFRTGSGLADYGGMDNLLECVSTYVHEVAGLNAANVFSMRAAAQAFDLLGRGRKAESLRREASRLAGQVNELYVEGRGYWNARLPDGSLVPVRHCYDFSTVISSMAEDLSATQTKEMVEFFRHELQTPAWMHALSPGDPNAMFSVRPDHQWTGAYTAWPALAVAALYTAGESETAFEWLKGLAKSTNQGPFGQAHFVESVVPAEDGGARKAPSEFPWINDWACSSNGAWVSLVIESIFGVRAPLSPPITAEPRFGSLDRDSRLVNLRYQGELYDVDASGIRKQ